MRAIKIFKIVAAVVVSVSIVGCAGMNGGPASSYDRIGGVQINETKLNDLPMGLENFSMTLDMRQEISASGQTNYCFAVACLSLGQVAFVPNFGQSLTILADTNRFGFTATSHQGGRFFYPATEEQLKTVARASNVEVRFTNIAGRSIDKKLAAKNRENFREFSNRFLQ